MSNPESKPVKSDTIKFGDTFYLRHVSGNYLIAVDSGIKYYFPQLGNTGKVRLQIAGQEDGELTNDSTIQIKSQERVLGSQNILGAFSDTHECYYYTEGYKEKQEWKISKKNQDGDNAIRYGDEVYLTNLSFKDQRLSREKGYVTTVKNANEWWILEPETTQAETQFEPKAPAFSQANLVYLAYCANVAYDDSQKSKRKLEKLGLNVKYGEYEHFFESPETDTQGFIVNDNEKIIIAFRGTESGADTWYSNAGIIQEVWTPEHPNIKVHNGFNKAFNSVWDALKSRLDLALALTPKPLPIWITGHSLGGALATLACAKLRLQQPKYNVAGVYTFGQPRVGNDDFAKALDDDFAKALNGDSKNHFFRVVDNNDPVPFLPTKLTRDVLELATTPFQSIYDIDSYKHVGQEIYFATNGEMYFKKDISIPWTLADQLYGVASGSIGNVIKLDFFSSDHGMNEYEALAKKAKQL